MTFLTLTPSPRLAGVIERIWIREGPPPCHAFDRVLPAGREEIIINLNDGELRCYHDDGNPDGRTAGPIFAGMHRGGYVIDTRQQSAIMGVHFKPGGAWRLLGIPAHELSNARIDFQLLIGEDAHRLMDRLMRAASPMEKLHLVDAMLCERRLHTIHPAVAWAAEQMTRYPAMARVALLAEEAGLSGRRLSGLFASQIGISPKGFARLRRFQSVLGRIHSAANPDWCDVALKAGYADQAHLIREFREFSGFSPTGYHAQRGHVPHLVPLPLVTQLQVRQIARAA
jgi:AraC-like DNA-binding protein